MSDCWRFKRWSGNEVGMSIKGIVLECKVLYVNNQCPGCDLVQWFCKCYY